MAIIEMDRTAARSPAQQRRIKRMLIDPRALVGLFQASDDQCFYLTTRDALPADAEGVGGGYDFAQGVFVVYVASASFDPVPENRELPEISPETTVRFVPTASVLLAQTVSKVLDGQASKGGD